MKSLFRSLNILSETELAQLDNLSGKRYLRKGEYLISHGETAHEIVYISSGILRLFYLNQNGHEITSCLSFEGQLLSAYSSFITQQPTEENIQAVSDTELLVLTRESLDYLYNSGPSWQQAGRILTEMQYVELAERVMSFQKFSAAERYHELLQKQPKYIQSIPQHQIASYLGITPRHFTRLRKGMLNTDKCLPG